MFHSLWLSIVHNRLNISSLALGCKMGPISVLYNSASIFNNTNSLFNSAVCFIRGFVF